MWNVSSETVIMNTSEGYEVRHTCTLMYYKYHII